MFPAALFSRPPQASGSGPTCVDVVGQPQETLIDLNGLTGAHFVTGGQGLCFRVPVADIGFFPWFNTGTENESILGSNPTVEVGIQVTDTAPSIATELAAAINASPYTTYISAQVVNGAGSNTAVLLTTQSNVNYGTVTDGFEGSYQTGAAFSQTQLGFPSAHICSPTSDALAGISSAFRGQCTYLGVTANAGGLGKPGYTTQDLNGNQLLFQDSAMTVPAVNQGDTVAALYDPISGLSAIQTNSMMCPTINFSQDSQGMLVPFLEFNGSSTYLQKTNPVITGIDNWSMISGLNPASLSKFIVALSNGANNGFSISQGNNTNGVISTLFGAVVWADTTSIFTQNEFQTILSQRTSGVIQMQRDWIILSETQPSATPITPTTATYFGWDAFNGHWNGGISCAFLATSPVSLTDDNKAYISKLSP